MFNSASVAIRGNETMSCELRVRTCIELNLNFEFYQTHFHYENFKLVYDLEEASLECAIDGEYSSIFAMQALASVLGREIMSVYPAMNGMLDKSISILNVVLHPRISTFRNKSKDRLYLMWTRCSGTLPRQRNRTWFPNHFVPLVQQDIQEVEILTDSPSPQAPQSNIHTPPQKLGRECDESTSVPLTTPLMTSSPCFDNNADLAKKHDDTNVTKSPTETSSLSDSLDSQSSVRKDEKKKPSFKPQPVNSLLMEDTQQSYVSLSQDLSSGKQFQAVHHDNKQQSTNKLNGRFLDVQSLCELLQHELSKKTCISY
jgi:hypothetical protein